MTLLKNMLKDLLTNSIDDVFSKIGSSELEKYYFVRYLPVFKANGTFDDQKKIIKINIRRIMRDGDIESKPYYKSAFSKLEGEISTKFPQKNGQDLTELTREEMFDFLISYFDSAGFKKFDVEKFLHNFQIFNNHLSTELDIRYCFSTLLNFNGNFEEQKLDNKLHIRTITPDEFAAVSGIESRGEKIDIDPSLFKIKYVIGKTLDRTSVREQDVLKLFEKTLDALRVFRNGNVQLGGLYFRNSQFWQVKPTFVLRREPKTLPTDEYVLDSSKLLADFKLFHSKLYGVNLTKGKYTFLDRSIRRFSNAIENRSTEERIVDFVISLESLYSSNEQELAYKFSIRVAAILGSNSREKINLQRMMHKIYDMRIRIVHGGKIPKQIKLERKSLEMVRAVELLERISRNSIMIFFELLEHYGKKEDIHRDIENAIFDDVARLKLSKIIRSSKYINSKFLKEIA